MAVKKLYNLISSVDADAKEVQLKTTSKRKSSGERGASVEQRVPCKKAREMLLEEE